MLKENEITVDDVVRYLKPKYPEIRNFEEKLLYLAQWGSRVYGTNNPESDWDFVAVLAKPACDSALQPRFGPSRLKEYEIHLSEDGLINVTILTPVQMQLLLYQHRIEYVETVFLPPECVWIEKDRSFLSFELDPTVFGHAVSAETGSTWGKAKRLMGKPGKLRKSKKELFHALRYLDFGIQVFLLHEKKIDRIDYSFTNRYYFEIMESNATSWPHYEMLYLPVFQEKKKEFFHYTGYTIFHHKFHSRQVHQATYREIQPSSTGTQSLRRSIKTSESAIHNTEAIPHLKIVEKLRADKNAFLALLFRTYSISMTRHPKYPYLVHFHCLAGDTPASNDLLDPALREIVGEISNGLILDESNNWNVVVFAYFSFDRIFNFTADVAGDDSVLFEKVDGSLAILYWFRDAWHVCSKFTPNGSETIAVQNRKDLEKVIFSEYFWRQFKRKNYLLPEDTNTCYLFELVANRQIANCEIGGLYFHGSRNLVSFTESDPVAIAQLYGWKLPRVVRNEDVPSSWSPFSREGVVIVKMKDGFVSKRLSFRSALFVTSNALTHISNVVFHKIPTLDSENIEEDDWMQLIRYQGFGEFLLYFPEWTELVTPLIRTFYERYETFLGLARAFHEKFVSEPEFQFIKKGDISFYQNELYLLKKFLEQIIPSREYYDSEFLCELYCKKIFFELVDAKRLKTIIKWGKDRV